MLNFVHLERDKPNIDLAKYLAGKNTEFLTGYLFWLQDVRLNIMLTLFFKKSTKSYINFPTKKVKLQLDARF